MSTLIRQKLRAFSAHLGISLLIFLVVLYFILFHWYPVPFFTSDGGWQGIRIVAAVDLILGPVLTFIVYKKGKPGLKFDFTVIGCIQIGALAWGLWVVHHERPIATVFAQEYFLTIKAETFDAKGITREQLAKYGSETPVWIYSKLPDDPDKLQELRIEAFKSGRTVHAFQEYYIPIGQDEIKKILASAIDMEAFLREKPEHRQKYEALLQKHREIQDELAFIRWRARFRYKIVVVRKDTLAYVDMLNIIPPEPKDLEGTVKKK